MSKLNKIERLKQELLPYKFDIENIDYHNLSEANRFYLKNFGIYNIKLAPQKFMLRIRLDGGIIEQKKFLKLINIAKEFSLKLLATTRAGLELHNILPSDILKIYYKIKELGLSTHQSLTDNVRNIVTDVYDGLVEDSKIECAPLITQIKEEFLDKKEFFGTIPRKFNTAIIGRVEPIINPWGSDLLFALAKKDSEYGFNIYLGGKNNQVAKDANIFVHPSDVSKFFRAVVLAFKGLGLRGSRSKTRLYYLLEEIGIEKFRDEVRKNFAKKLKNSGTLLMKNSKYKGIIQLKNGSFAKALNVNYGELELSTLEELLKEHKIRVGADQKLHLIGLRTKPNTIENATILACAGSRYCPLSLWDIKKDISPLELEKFAKAGINVGFSGCLKGCGHHLLSDIGLVGLRSNLYSNTEKALRVYFGAIELPKPTPARLLYFAVPLREVSTLFKAFRELFLASNYSDFRDLSAYLLKYKIETLQLFFLLKILGKIEPKTEKLFFNDATSNEQITKTLLNNDILPPQEELHKIVNNLAHKAWDER